MKTVFYVVSDFMLGIGGGIYTFIQDHVKMTNSLGCNTKLLVLGTSKCEHKPFWEFDCPVVLTEQPFNRYEANKMAISAIPKNAIVFCHSFEALRACLEAKRFCYNQHHYGDIIVPDSFTKYMDIHHMYCLPQWRQMMGISKYVINVAQSPGIAHWGKQVCGGEHVVAYEPYFADDLNQDEFNNAEESDVIIVSGNYKRKQIPEMLEALNGSDLKIQLFSTDKIRVPNNLDCTVHAAVPRERVLAHMAKSKVLLHLSKIEIMPYAVLEALQYIPAIVADVPYTKDFLLPAYVASSADNVLELCKEIPKKPFKPYNLNDYNKQAIEHWKELWKL